MNPDRGPHGGPGFTWNVERVRRPRGAGARRKTSYRLVLRDNQDPLFSRVWTATILRGFAEVAFDALEGHYHSNTGGRWSSNPFDADRIEIVEHRNTATEHLTFGREELDRIVPTIDELLEDK